MTDRHNGAAEQTRTIRLAVQFRTGLPKLASRMGDEQLELLRRIAAAVGVTPGVSGVSQITIGRLFVQYKATRPRGRAWRLERNLLRPFVVAYWRRLASSLSPADWVEHRARRRTQKTRLGRPPCELTLNLELKMAKRMLGPGSLVGCKPVKTRTRRESWFTAEQIAQLVAASSCLRWDHQQRNFRALVAVMADTGLRISEALGLRWDRITLRGTTSVLGKGAKTRVIGFTARALEAMGSLPRHANPHVFVNWRTGKTWDGSTVRAWFRRAIEAAQLEGAKADGDLALVPHVLRHSFASIADERGAKPNWIQNALGHANASTTAVYLHRNEADAALRMAAIMGNRANPRRAVRPSGAVLKKELATPTVKGVRSFS
jgi:integrase